MLARIGWPQSVQSRVAEMDFELFRWLVLGLAVVLLALPVMLEVREWRDGGRRITKQKAQAIAKASSKAEVVAEISGRSPATVARLLVKAYGEEYPGEPIRLGYFEEFVNDLRWSISVPDGGTPFINTGRLPLNIDSQ